MPPLRERGNDIVLLAEHFLKIANEELGRNVCSFAPEVIECFMNYRWQGNIRELKNIVRRAALITEGDQITLKALPLEISNGTNSFESSSPVLTEELGNVKEAPRNDLKNIALEAEYDTILRVLKEVSYNKTKAAEILNIDRKTLYNK